MRRSGTIERRLLRERRISLYGDGKWHFTSGERRITQRRLGKPRIKVSLDSPEFDSLTLEDQLDALSKTASQTEARSLDDSSKNVSMTTEVFDAESMLQTSRSPVAKQTNSTSTFESISTPSWDAQRATKTTDDNNTTSTADSKEPNAEPRRRNDFEKNQYKNPFENAIESTALDADENSAIVTNKVLGPEDKARLHSLKTMLDASNARYAQASKKRSPVFAAGLVVRVTQGSHMGNIGTIVDADYIEDRALLTLPDQDTPKWIDFKSLGHAD